MTNSKKISVFQLYAVFFISRVTAFFTFIAPSDTPFSPGDRMILFIPFFLFSALFSLPVFLVTKDGKTLPDLAGNLSPFLPKILTLVYFIAVLWNAGVSIAKFEFFMTTAMFSEAILFPFTALFLIACVYIAMKQTQSIARCCTILLVLLLVSVTAIMISTIKEFDVNNLTLPLGEGIFPLLKNGFSAAARTPETAALLFIKPEVNGKTNRAYFLWLALFGLFGSIALGFIAGVTGRFGDNQTFQLYTLTVLAKFGPFEKADDILSGLWVLCSLFRTAFCISFAAKNIEMTFAVKNKYMIYFLSGFIVFSFYYILSRSVGTLSGVLASGINELLFAVLTGAVPFIVFAAFVMKKKTNKKEGALRI